MVPMKVDLVTMHSTAGSCFCPRFTCGTMSSKRYVHIAHICFNMYVASNSASIMRCPGFYYSGSTWLHGCRPGKCKVVPTSRLLKLNTNTMHTCTLGTQLHSLQLCLSACPQTTSRLKNAGRSEGGSIQKSKPNC